jgi:hypothetical protein
MICGPPNVFCPQRRKGILIFNVFHVHALYYTKTLSTNKCTKRVLSSIVTHSYMFRPCWVMFREKFFVIVTLRLHFIVECECAVDCVLRCFWRRELSVVPACSTQSTAHYHSTIKCNLSVTITKSSPWRWPKRVETCRSVLRLMIKLSLCICWWLVFSYFNIFFCGPVLQQYATRTNVLEQNTNCRSYTPTLGIFWNFWTLNMKTLNTGLASMKIP